MKEECWRHDNFNICFGTADSKSLVSAGGDNLEGLNPDCNGILICEIVHLHT